MPQILCVNNYHYPRGGAEIVYLAHMAMMEELGWEVACFSMRHPENLPSKWSGYFVDEIEYGHDYSLAEKITGAAKAVYSVEARRQLSRLLAEFKPDIAHLHNIYHHLSPSILSLLQDAGVPVVLTAHDLKLACPAYRMFSGGEVCERCKDGSTINLITRRCVKGSVAASAVVAIETVVHRRLNTWKKHIDRVVVPSRFYFDKLVEWGWRASQLYYLPNYVDSSSLQPEYRPGRYILYFGRVEHQKGIDTLIRAAAKASVPLMLVGTGPHEREAKQLAAALGAEAKFMGYQRGAALHALIREARAVVLPSEAYENAPMSLLEASAMGKPVIGADIGGIPELILAEETGWVFPSGDVGALSALLSRVSGMKNDALTRIGLRGRQMVVEHYSKAVHLARLTALYNTIASADMVPK